MNTLDYDLKKLQFQIQQLTNTVDYNAFPVEYLVLTFDWSQADLQKAHDVFDDAQKRIERGENISYYELEGELRKSLGLNYQQVKSVAIAFYQNGQWIQVCREYARSFGEHPPIEILAILND